MLVLAFPGAAMGQTGESDELRLLRERLDRLEQHTRDLEARESRRVADEKIQEEAKGRDAAAKPDAATIPQEVGSDLRLNAVWDNGLFFVSPNKDWKIHVGGRFQFNSVWWQQPEFLKGPAPGVGGVPAQGPGGGVDILENGTYFRRVRFRADGTAYELVEFAEEVNFENLNFITFDHIWVGAKQVPFVGTIRIGQQKVPQSLDMIGTDYYLTFMERSALADAFWTLFAPGILAANTYFNENVTTQSMIHKVQPLQYYDGAAFGNGDWASTSRITWTPWYADDGAHVVHLGGSYQWRSGNLGRDIFPGGTGNTFADTQQVARFRARPELRDAVGILSPGIGGSAGRFVDTGYLIADSVQTISPEFMTTCGPLNVRAEAAWAFAENVQSIYPAAAFLTPRGNPTFWGGYMQASYFLTGEHWGYDRRFGVYERPRINENAFLVRGEDGAMHHGIGAWEVAYRFSFIDLNDNGINGGQLTEHTIGLNWYLNENFRLQANYLNILRNVATPANSGTVHGFGVQAQWYF